MKFALIAFCSLLLLLFSILLFLIQQSKTPPELGLVDGQFSDCIYASNCVNSMAQGKAAIAPIPLSEQGWEKLPRVIRRMGGELVQQDGHYLRATFRTPMLGFVDDMELLWVRENALLQVRASSRVGRSDFAANRKRVEALREHLLLMH